MIEPRAFGIFPTPTGTDLPDRRRAEQAEYALVAEHAARREAEVTAERFRFLAEAGALLASSLDEDAVASNLAHLGLAMLADWCAVFLVDGAHVHRVAVASLDPQLDRRAALPDDEAHQVLAATVIGSARSRMDSDTQHWSSPGPRLCVPLIARGRCLGAVLFVRSHTSRSAYEPAEVSLGEELARHAASALTNARLYAEQHRLQESLLLSETMSAIGTVAAGVAHEARNPLFGISSTLDGLESSFPARSELQPFIEKLRHEVERLGRLMSDLLQYGKPGSSQRGSYPIGDVVARAIAHCEPIAARAGVVLHSRFDRDALPTMPIERERLVRVFQNLLENAIEHSGRGGTVSIDASVVESDGMPNVQCHVIDSGSGFEAGDLPRVFEPFFTRRQSGTGLGLSIVQRIVREHGGSVSAANGENGGAVVTVRLPVATAGSGR